GEGWLVGSIPNAEGPEFTFFDTHFFQYGKSYSYGMEANFALAGLCYWAGVIRQESKLVRMSHYRDGDFNPREFLMAGAAMLVPHEESRLGPDTYQFQGPAKQVEALETPFGNVTLVTATVVRVGLTGSWVDVDIGLYVPDRVWATNERPAPG